MALDVEIITGVLAGGFLSGIVGGTVANAIWRFVRFRPGREFSYQDFLEGMRVGGAQEEEYQFQLNEERLKQLQMFCDEHNDQGYVPIEEMFQYINTLWTE